MGEHTLSRPIYFVSCDPWSASVNAGLAMGYFYDRHRERVAAERSVTHAAEQVLQTAADKMPAIESTPNPVQVTNVMAWALGLEQRVAEQRRAAQ